LAGLHAWQARRSNHFWSWLVHADTPSRGPPSAGGPRRNAPTPARERRGNAAAICTRRTRRTDLRQRRACGSRACESHSGAHGWRCSHDLGAAR